LNLRATHTKNGENADDLDSDILEVSEYAVKQVDSVLKTVIGYITVDATDNYPDESLFIPGSDGRATVMGNWMCDIYRSICQADVAFVNAGGVRTAFSLEGRESRDITVSNVYEMFPLWQ
jgi:2',3'-cyclic-nucleotide 2'-phosphodiesterase (5'-nucleotidase family)